MKDKIYYTCKDVQELLSCSRTNAYKRIKELNDELKGKGYLVRNGMIPKKYFAQRYGI